MTAPLTWQEIDDWRRYQADDRVVAALDAGAQMAAALEDLGSLLDPFGNARLLARVEAALAAWRQAVAPR